MTRDGGKLKLQIYVSYNIIDNVISDSSSDSSEEQSSIDNPDVSKPKIRM